MLGDVGFVDIRSERRVQLIGEWAGDIGASNQAKEVRMFRGIKTPILEAVGFGYVTSEADYDELLDGLSESETKFRGPKRIS